MSSERVGVVARRRRGRPSLGLRSSSRRQRSTALRSPGRRTSNATAAQVVDLTECDNVFVDLTNVSNNFDNDDSVIVIVDTPSISENNRHTSTNNNHDSGGMVPALILSDSESESELPPLPAGIITQKSMLHGAAALAVVSEPPLSSVTTGFNPTCPICLGSFEEIRGAGRQIMATVCGHTFCRECIDKVLKAPAAADVRCPTCRKKLSKRSVHVLYL